MPEHSVELLQSLFDVWNAELGAQKRKMHRLNHRKAVSFGLSVGALTVAKYYLRCASSGVGRLWYDGPQENLLSVDTASSSIANAYLMTAAGFSSTWPTPPRRTLRWAQVEIDDETPLAGLELTTALIEKANVLSARVERRLLAVIDADAGAETSERAVVGRWITVTALGKIAVALLDHAGHAVDAPRLAGAAEHLAELSSQQIYMARSDTPPDLQTMADRMKAKTEDVMAKLNKVRVR